MTDYTALKPGFYWVRQQTIDSDGFYNDYATEENAWCIVEVTGIPPFLTGKIVYTGDGIQPPVNTIYSPDQWEWDSRIPTPKTLRKKKNVNYEAKRFLVRR